MTEGELQGEEWELIVPTSIPVLGLVQEKPLDSSSARRNPEPTRLGALDRESLSLTH
jgi:hypothetical protein